VPKLLLTLTKMLSKTKLLAAFVIVLLVTSCRPLTSQYQQLSVRFTYTDAITQNTLVSFQGNVIGKVQQVTRPDALHTMAKIVVPNEIFVSADARFVFIKGLLGETIIQIVPGSARAPIDLLAVANGVKGPSLDNILISTYELTQQAGGHEADSLSMVLRHMMNTVETPLPEAELPQHTP